MEKYFKYHRTMHLPWSPGTTSDDKIMHDISPLLGKTVVTTDEHWMFQQIVPNKLIKSI